MSTAEAVKHPDPVVRAGADRLAALMRAARPEQGADQAQEPKAREVKPLPPFMSQDLDEAVRCRYFRPVPESVSIADIMNDETRMAMLSVAAPRLKPNDAVSLRLVGHLVELFVVSSQHSTCVTVVTAVHELPMVAAADPQSVPPGFRIYQSHTRRWLILREKDGVLLGGEDGHASFEEARRHLHDHPTLRAQ